MTTQKSIGPAVGILMLVGIAAFVATTLAVSSASTDFAAKSGPSIEHPFSTFSFTGSVGTAKPTQPKNFTLGFNTAFTLAQDDPGIVNQRAKTLDAVRIQEAVEYPVPSSQRFVGPARLPFGSQLLLLKIRIRGRCFPANPNNSYNFIGEVKDCATASLVLGKKSYDVLSLLKGISGNFTPSSTKGRSWTATISATFKNPGYTFPVATLGRHGGTSFLIGNSGGTLATRAISFEGGRQP